MARADGHFAREHPGTGSAPSTDDRPAGVCGHARSAGITGWSGNTPVPTRDGLRYPDILFDEVKLLLEIDGRAHHSSPEAFEADRSRQNQLVLAGWTVLRFTPKQLAEQPADVIALIRGTIARLQGK